MPPPPTNQAISFRPKLPYKAHPIYKLRYATIWTLFIGLVLVFLVMSFTAYSLTILVFLYATSFFFIVHDLMTWAIEKAALVALHLPISISAADGRVYQRINDDGSTSRGDGDDDSPSEPVWPRLYIIIVDAIFALVYQCIFWLSMVYLRSWPHYSYEGSALNDYAALSTFVMSVLHGMAFREELKARCKSNLIKELEQTPCRQCGQVNPIAFQRKENNEAGNDSATVFGLKREEFGIPGWAKAFNERRNRASRGQRDDIEAGRPTDEDETENLVIAPTPESSKGYGTLSQSVHSLSGKGEEVVKKKGLKRVIGEDWSTGLDNANGKGKAKVEEDSEDGA